MLTDFNRSMFRDVFTHPEDVVVQQNLAALLPGEVACLVDWTTLAHHPGSYLAGPMRKDSLDILYTAKYDREPAFLHFVFIARSRPDPLLHYWITKAQVAIWDEWHRAHPATRQLPPILPLVLLQGGDDPS